MCIRDSTRLGELDRLGLGLGLGLGLTSRLRLGFGRSGFGGLTCRQLRLDGLRERRLGLCLLYTSRCV